MYFTTNFRWVISSKKLNDLISGKQLVVEKSLCKIGCDEWALKLLRKKPSKAKSDSFGLVLERDNRGKDFKTEVKITINLYRLKSKLHILQKSLKKLVRENENPFELVFGSEINEMVIKRTASVISGTVMIKEKQKLDNLESLCEDIETEASDQLSNDLSKFCCNQLFSDIVLTCNNRTFPAHKLILAARCPYFAELLQNSEISQIYITDLKPDVLKAMLTYIYSAITKQLTQELACDLLIATITYKLKGLKIICVNYLRSIMTVKNVISICILAFAIDEELKIHALKYISNNFSSIETSDEWQSILKEKPTLATQILSEIAKSIE